jgi:predicted Zn-dependent protease
MLTRVIDQDPDRLGFILGHELGHVLLNHVTPSEAAEKTPFLHATFTRDQELAADRKGMALALAAGYSYRRAARGIHRILELGLDYSSFEGLRVDHPSWKDRLAALDGEQAALWSSMASFENGTVFLLVEQYAPAERCFRAVTREFPACHEAWSGLGYALLMQYCDALEPADLRRFGVGQIACGAFYRRPATLEAQVRGIDEDLWWDAVGALREALRLKPDSVPAKANLGIAYLVRPAGPDTGQATRFLQEAADAAMADTALDPLARASVLANAGVADLAAGQPETSARRLEEAEKQSKAFAAPARAVASTLSITSTLLYNRARLLVAGKDPAQRKTGVEYLVRYLKSSSPASVWWSLAYEDYRRTSGELRLSVQAEAAFKTERALALRPVTGVTVGPKKLVTLADRMAEARKQLDPAVEGVPVVPGTNLLRFTYPKQGLELLGSERVLAIFLSGAAAPPLTLRSPGLGGPTVTLRSGMTQAELEQALPDLDYDFRQLVDPEVNYRFYRDLGLAVRLREGKVLELVIVQVPERRLIGAG